MLTEVSRGEITVTDRHPKASECSETIRRHQLDGLGEIRINLGGRSWWDDGHHSHKCGTVELTWIGAHVSLKLQDESGWTPTFLRKANPLDIAEKALQIILNNVAVGPMTSWILQRSQVASRAGVRQFKKELQRLLTP